MMETIRREDFADEKSRGIFEHRFNYYTTGNMEHILNMVTEEYNDFAGRIVELRKKLYARLKEFDGKLLIYGAGVHAGLTMDFLERMALDNKFAGCCVSDAQEGGGGAKLIEDFCDKKNIIWCLFRKERILRK